MNLKDKVDSILVGIKFAKSFRINDIHGEIFDHVLYHKNSPLKNFFEKVGERNNDYILLSKDDSEYLRMTTEDIVLKINVDKNYSKKYNWLKTEVMNYFKEMLKSHKIHNFRRIGLVISHKFENLHQIEDIVSYITKEEVKEVNNFNITFNQKLTTKEFLYRKNVNDYKNVIYEINKTEDGYISRLDFQYLYDPMIVDLQLGFTDKIFDSADDFLEFSFYKWVKHYVQER